MKNIARQKQSGFTLIELMMAIAILAILVTIAAPSFDSMITNNRIKSQLRGLGDHLKLARSTAIGRGIEVTVCHLDGPATSITSACDGGWSNGWAVFIDDNQDGIIDAVDNVLKVHEGVGSNVLTITDNAGAGLDFIRFGGRGTSNGMVTIELCDEDTGDDALGRAILVQRTGMGVFSRINTSTNVYKDINGTDLDCND